MMEPVIVLAKHPERLHGVIGVVVDLACGALCTCSYLLGRG